MDVTILGAGMIVHDQILPSFYQLRRLGLVRDITVCSRRAETIQALNGSASIAQAFPDQTARMTIEPYEAVLASVAPGNVAVIALPDHLHLDAILEALRAGHHVIVVKPLALRVSHALAIEKEARDQGLFAGIEYHKRLDDRSLMARRRYRAGEFGEFRLGTASLMEKWRYRHSNFQNWCTLENSDAFTYVGCHYVDLVHFITGLHPAAVSVYGIEDTFPNGRRGYLWTDARVIWENGACLNVQNSLSLADEAPGSNVQGMTLHCSTGDGGAMIRHSDQYRGLEYVERGGYSEPSPDYFQYVDLGGPGLTPAGYGYRSIERLWRACLRVAEAGDKKRALDEIDAEGLLATPANSRHNELVIEAARESILCGGRTVTVESRHASKTTIGQ